MFACTCYNPRDSPVNTQSFKSEEAASNNNKKNDFLFCFGVRLCLFVDKTVLSVKLFAWDEFVNLKCKKKMRLRSSSSKCSNTPNKNHKTLTNNITEAVLYITTPSLIAV